MGKGLGEAVLDEEFAVGCSHCQCKCRVVAAAVVMVGDC